MRDCFTYSLSLLSLRENLYLSNLRKRKSLKGLFVWRVAVYLRSWRAETQLGAIIRSRLEMPDFALTGCVAAASAFRRVPSEGWWRRRASNPSAPTADEGLRGADPRVIHHRLKFKIHKRDLPLDKACKGTAST